MKQFFKQGFKALRFRLSAQNHFLFKWYYKYAYRPKPNSLAAHIDAFSRNAKQPVFVLQIGANDGITHDPIHKFIKRDGWHGVLLEPQPLVFDTCLQPIYAQESNIETLNKALGQKDGTAILYNIGFSSKRWATGLSTFNKSVLLKAFEDGRIAQFAKKYGEQIPHDKNEWIKEEEIDVIAAKTLIKNHVPQAIDLLQIDTEGYDFEIIKLLLAESKPGCIIFEHHHFDLETATECSSFLEKRGYSLKQFEGNTVAEKQESYSAASK